MRSRLSVRHAGRERWGVSVESRGIRRQKTTYCTYFTLHVVNGVMLPYALFHIAYGYVSIYLLEFHRARGEAVGRRAESLTLWKMQTARESILIFGTGLTGTRTFPAM